MPIPRMAMLAVCLAAIAYAAEPAKPGAKPELTTEQKLDIARLQSAIYRAQADNIRVEAQVATIPEVKAAREALKKAAEAFQAQLAALKLGEGCEIDDKQEVKCPEPKKEAAKQ